MAKILGLSLAGILLAMPAVADEVVISQNDRSFSPNAVTIQEGDALVFVNDDRVSHNVFIRIGSDKKDVGLQKPGEQDTIAIDETGRFRARCAIHPQMKLDITVE